MHRIKIAAGLGGLLALSKIGIFLRIFGIMFAEDLFVATLGAGLGLGIEMFITIIITALLVWYVTNRRK